VEHSTPAERHLGADPDWFPETPVDSSLHSFLLLTSVVTGHYNRSYLFITHSRTYFPSILGQSWTWIGSIHELDCIWNMDPHVQLCSRLAFSSVRFLGFINKSARTTSYDEVARSTKTSACYLFGVKHKS